jgi:hypothetical protein
MTEDTHAKKKDTYSYKGWMNSDSLIKRSFGVYGHYLLAGLMIAGSFLAVILVVSLIASIVKAVV